MTEIHPTAVIDSEVVLGKNVSVGAFTHISGNVAIGDGVVVENHVSICGNTKIGAGTHIFPFASLGNQPQDLKYKGEETFLEIGEYNRIREHVTINRGTKGGGEITRLGNNCLLMNGVHIGHDCIIGNDVVFASNATLGGHVLVGNFAVLGGLSAVQQFCRIGEHAMVGGLTGVDKDIVPFALAKGARATLEGLNLVGLRRRNFATEDIKELQSIFKDIFFGAEDTFIERVEAAEAECESDVAKSFVGFILADRKRGFISPIV